MSILFSSIELRSLLRASLIALLVSLPFAPQRCAAIDDTVDELHLNGLGSKSDGLPRWGVSEPYINLWIIDTPLAYKTSSGKVMSFDIARDQNGYSDDPSVFSIGPGWECSWRSYVKYYLGGPWTNSIGLYGAYMPMGGIRDYVPDGITPEFGSLSTMSVFTTNSYLGGGGWSGFLINYPDGSQDIYGFVVPRGSAIYAMLSESIDPSGRSTKYYYNPSEIGVFGTNPTKLLSMVDPDGRTTYFNYPYCASCITNGDPTPRQIANIQSPYNYYAGFTYEPGCNYCSSNLMSVVNAEGMVSTFTNNGVAQLQMTTPYGTTTFDWSVYSGPYTFFTRSMFIWEPDGGRQIYGYLATCDPNAVPTSFPASHVPDTSLFAANTFDNSQMNYRNSVYWDKYASSKMLSFINTNDFLNARVRHWLDDGTGNPSFVLSMERMPSPDGVTEGQKTWYDYPGKGSWQQIGTDALPSYIARRLPGGSSQFVWNQRNSAGYATNVVSTYSSNSVVLLRTNTFSYATNNIDLLRAYGPNNELLAGYSYNTNHQVLTATNAVGDVAIYTYDATSRLPTSVKTPAGLTTTNIYYSGGLTPGFLQQTIDLELTRTNSFTYANGLVSTITDPRGAITTNQYDGLNRLTSSADSRGTTSFIYTNADLCKVVDRLGNASIFQYNSIRQKTRQIDALGRNTYFYYHLNGGLSYVVNALSQVAYNYYDNLGRLTGTLGADGAWTTNRYNLINQVTNTADSAGSSVTNWFSNSGLPVTSSNAFGQISLAVYDNRDRVVSATDANGLTITTAYDNANRVLTKSYPDGGVEKFLYSVKGVVGYTNQLGQVTRTDYDVAGRAIALTNANLEVVNYSYNAAGDRRTLTDGKGQVTSWGYDQFGRGTSETNAASAEIFRFQYDANNRLTNRWTLGKGSATFKYDAVGNKTNVVYAVSPALVFGYDALNRATNMVDAVGASALTYNSAGLLASEDGPWASDTVTYSYANRLRTAFSLAAPNAPDWAQSYAYDSAKRLTSLTSPAGTFGYNYVGSCGCPAGSLVNRLTLPNGSFITNNFDGMARLMDTSLKNSGGTAQSSRAYTYNLASWRVSETRLDGSFVNYGYDNIGQLTNAVGKEAGGVTNRLHESYAYAYDKAGNLSARTNNALVQSFGVNSKNELTSVTRSGTLTVAGFTTASANSVAVNGNSATRYTDWTFAKSGLTVTNGNNTFSAIATDTLGRADTNTVAFNLPATVSYTYDGNGNLTSDGTRGLDYDDENQLIRVTVTNNWKTEFVYDGQQRRRIRKEYIWQSSAWALTAEVRYIFDGNLEIQQRDANNLPMLTLTRGRDLGGGLENAGGIGGLLARTDHSTLNIQNSYFFSDGNGNVIALVNASQLVVAKYLYDSFGNVITSSGPLADANCYRFSSKELHMPSGLIYFGFRFYDPNLQRWVNKDPIGIKGGINLFAYIRNGPSGGVDPRGYEGILTGIAPILQLDITQEEWNGLADTVNYPKVVNGFIGGENGSDVGFCPDSTMQDVERYHLIQMRNDEIGGNPTSMYATELAHDMVIAVETAAEFTPADTLSIITTGTHVGGRSASPLDKVLAWGAGLTYYKCGKGALNASKKLIKYWDDVSRLSLRNLSLTSGSKKLRELGLIEDTWKSGRHVFIDEKGHIRVTWDGDHWDKYAPGGGGIRLNDGGHVVDPWDPKAHIPSTGTPIIPGKL